MNLNQWMQAHSLSDTKVEKLSGLDRTTVWKIRRGLRNPSPKAMTALVKASDGLITRRELRPDLYPDEGRKART